MTQAAPHRLAPEATKAPRARGWHRLWPDSLFGRLLLVLSLGLLLAQGASALINLAERERLLERSFGMQPAQRIADIVHLLDDLGPAERDRLLGVFAAPPLVLSIVEQARVPAGEPAAWPARRFAARLQAALGDGRELRVAAREGVMPAGTAVYHGADAYPGRHGRGMGPGMRGPGGMGSASGTPAAVLRTEVRLRDGRWAAINHAQPIAPALLPWQLAASLSVLLLSVLVLAYGAVRWLVRPLRQLTQAADALGRDLARAPLPVSGPLEVRQAARAFNTMQERLAGFIQERARVLAALSHDLKTPLTRMRLHAELLDDENMRARFEADLLEMQTMVEQTLEVLRGLGNQAQHTAVDINAVATALQADQAALGRELSVQGRAQAPWQGEASLLKRCVGNLVDNAFNYGGTATLLIDDSEQQLVLRVVDTGPGIPEADRERVFEPFLRLESSRNRATGGTGLGLGIARSIARGFGGDLVLQGGEQGGLVAAVTLPRRPG